MSDTIIGGEKAIAAARRLLSEERRGDPSVDALGVGQIRRQMSLGVDRVMGEGSVYDHELAALALKQAWGDVSEAIFLLRAYRTTLPRFGASNPIDTTSMEVRRRVSSTFKDLPGGQLLGATFDYSLRLLDFGLLDDDDAAVAPADESCEAESRSSLPKAIDFLRAEDLVEAIAADDSLPVADLTYEPIAFPAPRDLRLQALARGDEGFVVGLAYSSMRGHGANHPMVGEIRSGEVEVEFFAEDIGLVVTIGRIRITECDMIHQFVLGDDGKPRLTHGFGMVFGASERKAMAMAIVDRALRSAELGEPVTAPIQDQEFVLSHLDNLAAAGHVEHLKLPHYVDFQAELILLRAMRAAENAALPAASSRKAAPAVATIEEPAE